MAAEKETKPEAKQPTSVAVRLSDSAPTGQPLLANYASAQPLSGLLLLELGFLEPAMLTALARAARAGGKVPKAVQGKLAARVALTPEAARALHQQLSKVLAPKAAEKKVLN